METTTEVKLSPELRKKLDAAVRVAKPRRVPWSPTEDAVLRGYYLKLPTKELTKFLPGRTIHAITCRARTIGLARGWNQ